MEYFTLLALYNCILSSFAIHFQSRKDVIYRKVKFLQRLEICCVLYTLYTGSVDVAVRVHIFHICIQSSPADLYSSHLLNEVMLKMV